MGKRKFFFTEIQIQEIILRYSVKNDSISEIVNDFNCSPYIIRKILRNNNIKTDGKTRKIANKIDDLNLIYADCIFWEVNEEFWELNINIFFINSREILKRCSHCENIKKLDEFNQCMKNSLFLHGNCRDCGMENKRKWYYENQEDHCEKQKKKMFYRKAGRKEKFI